MNWDLWLPCYDKSEWDYYPYWRNFMNYCWDNKLNRVEEAAKWNGTYELYISEEVIKFKSKSDVTMFLLKWS